MYLNNPLIVCAKMVEHAIVSFKTKRLYEDSSGISNDKNNSTTKCPTHTKLGMGFPIVHFVPSLSQIEWTTCMLMAIIWLRPSLTPRHIH